MKRKILLFLLCAAFCISFAGCSDKDNKSSEEIKEDVGYFDIECLCVGKADAFILTTENHAVMIDTGEKGDGEEVADAVISKEFDTLDYLILTHYDKDHIGGVQKVLEKLNVNQIIETPIPKSADPNYGEFVEMVKNSGVSENILKEKITFTLDNVIFTVYPPEAESYEENESNNSSLIVTVKHADNSFLFMGDAQKYRIKEWISNSMGNFDFLKVPYHGEYMNAEEKLFEQVKPLYAVITCSKKNPAEEDTLKSLEKNGAKVYETSKGNISVKSDGYKLSVTQ